MSIVGLEEAEKLAKSLQRKIHSSLVKQSKQIKSEIAKIEFLLGDKSKMLEWRTNPANKERIGQLLTQLDEVEQLYLEAGDSNAATLFKSRMTTQLRQKLNNLRANQIEVQIRAEAFKAETKLKTAKRLQEISQEGAYKEAYRQSLDAGGFLSNFGKSFIGDIVTFDTKAAGSKTLGDYMNNLYKTYEKGLRDVYVSGIVRGDSYKQMISNLQKKTNITVGKANLLVRTEANAIFNDSVKRVIEGNPLVKGYRFRATLDSRTSKICQEHDGEFIAKDDIKPGINYPPLHPNCRSTVTTVLVNEDEKKDITQRFTKNGRNEWIAVPIGTTYAEFKAKVADLENSFGKKIPTTATLSNYSIRKTNAVLKEAEAGIMNSPVERAVVLTPNGEKISLLGTSAKVDPTVLGEEVLDGSILTHNHPASIKGPSSEDLKVLAEYKGIKELRTVDKTNVYSLKLLDKDLDWKDLKDAHAEAVNEVLQKLWTGELAYEEGEDDYQRLVMEQLYKNHPDWLEFSYKKHNYRS